MNIQTPEHTTFFYGGTDTIEEADIVLAGFSYDCTASFRAGTRFGPRELRSYPGDGLETFSFYFGEDLEDVAYHDAGDMEPVYGDPLPMIDIYKAAASELISENRRLIAIGGEHLITYPFFLATKILHGNFTMVHLDAHADLAIINHVGSRVAHGTVMNLCLEAGLQKLVQYGIRSGNRQEWEMRQNDPRIIPATSLEEFDDSLDDGEKIYLTIDVDFFDPAYVPGTGTPEAGGASFGDYVQILKILRRKRVRIIGADLVELAPELDSSRNSTVFVGKVLRELLLTMHALK
ncbi:MAG: agmatinase [Spirochaetales bacterium]|nr:agmatinase [Spirochaetales bacterium]